MKATRVLPLYIVGSAVICGQTAMAAGHGFWMGAGIGAAAGTLPLFFLGMIHVLLPLWQPPRPRCQLGTCSSPDYQLLHWERPARSNALTLFYQCRCGTRYLHREKRFLVLDETGREHPYLAISPWGRWERDLS